MLQDFYGLDETYQENLLTKYYRKLGHKVIVIASTYDSVFDYVQDNNDSKKLKSVVYEFGAKIYKLPYSINILHKLKKHAGVFEILEKERPDLIYIHDIHLNLKEAVQYVKINRNCKIIMDYHADYTNSAKNWISLNILHKLIRKPFFNWYKKYISEIFPVVPASTVFLHEVYNVPLSKMKMLPLGCDYEKCLEIQKNTDTEALKNSLKIHENDFVIITGGKFDPIKKTEILIKAVEKINDTNIHLIVFGKAAEQFKDYEEELFNIVKKSNVHFLGWIDNDRALEYMTIADVAIFPASQSVLWQQAIGMHLPLIVGDLGGQQPEYLNFYENMITIKTEDILEENFGKHILTLKNDPVLLSKMKEGAKNSAAKHLDYKIICERTLQVLSNDI
ncbi:glycosyltransferase family 4 protein [Frigoriflavimonas asaccharolytica]|uniref:Glycosyltransferase involved in cell wall biosynthesis n=1 Tax=Frigoriflavimonas asaccharolytica TaxID=2735899 RepID=A0A8J8G5P6_9FLAO|nr:glycosyltransferase family 4 protein [Frigoriflavimonas asaccharolytica]NRS91721.1 glycosyltransferase involved in cell wall biosynthesis [Frigoriflavimonas asaccharolytica]